MKCREFESIVIDLVPEGANGELPREARAHAGGCARCARRLADERQLADAFGALRAELASTPEPRGLETLRRALERRAAPAPGWIDDRWIAAAAALLLVATAVTLGRATRLSGPPEETRQAAIDTAADPTAGEREVATDFVPLADGPEGVELDGGRLVRVEVPRSTLLAAGFPMNAERADEPITADVLLGHDGVARAIRFVQ
jgi:anti-sigma factor RsiW